MPNNIIYVNLLKLINFTGLKSLNLIDAINIE